jgi:hypothetical protein
MQPFSKMVHTITNLGRLRRPSEGLRQFQCCVASTHGLYPQVQLAQQAVDCFGDFSGNRVE